MMQRKAKLAVALSLVMGLFFSSAQAAEPAPKNEVVVGWGPKVLFRKDEIKSPRLYSGPALFSLYAGYNRTSDDDAHRLSLGFHKSTIRSQKDWDYYKWPDGELRTTEGDPLTGVRVRYGYFRKLDVKGPLRIDVGPAFDSDIQHATYLAGPYGVDGYYGTFTLDARGRASYSPSERHQLAADLALPLFGWVARSPYALSDSEQIMANIEHNGLKTFFRYIGRGKVRTWNQMQAVRFSARYSYFPARRWSLSGEVETRLLALSQPRPLLAHDYGLNLTAGYRF